MKIYLSLILSFFLIEKTQAQNNVHYYGWDTDYSHYPTDIIQTQDSGFLIIGGVISSEPAIENYNSHKYIVRTDNNGDTLWTRYYSQDYYGRTAVIETPDNDFKTFGEIDGGNTCDIISDIDPFSDYCIQTFSSLGDSISTVKYNDVCDDYYNDFIKTSDGGIAAIIVSSDFSSNYSYSLKEIDSNGVLSGSIPLQTNHAVQLEKTTNGYWLSSWNTLTKISFSGNILWQNPISLSSIFIDFCKTPSDSLIFLSSYADSSTVFKTDSSGNIDWSRTYHSINGSAIMYHSSGSYIISGQDSSNKLVLLVLGPNGDSLWSSVTVLPTYTKAVKTIETYDGSLATLARWGGLGLAGQYILMLDTIPNTCSAYFDLYEDTIPFNYIAVNMASGVSPLSYTWDWGDGNFDYTAYPSHTYATNGPYTICLSITDAGGCSNSYCSNLTFKTDAQMGHVNVINPLTIGINEYKEKLSLYPNPTTSTLTIQNASGLYHLSDITGKTLLSGLASGETFTLDISALSSGVYFLTLSEDGQQVVRKVVKQ